MKRTNLLILALLCAFSSLAMTDKDKDSLATYSPKAAFKIAPEALKTLEQLSAKTLEQEANRALTDYKVQTRSFESFDKGIDNKYFQILNRSREFTDEYISRVAVQDSSAIDSVLSKAVGTFQALDESGNWIENLQPTDLVELPVGIKKTINNVQYMLGVSGATFTPNYTELTAFVRIILPQEDAAGNQKQLFFGANNIRLSHQGGLQGDANLVLLGDIPFRINGGNGLVIIKGGFDMNTGNVDDRTYVTIDCDGFKELSIEAEVQFPRSMIVPLKEDYTVDETIDNQTGQQVKVKGNFQTVVSDWNDILVEISLPRFALASFKEGFAFDLNTAVFDFSDIRNSDNIIWPSNYQQNYLEPGNEQLWRGVYVRSLTVALPEAFKRRNSNERITLQAANLLIDGVGVSGEFSVDNILPLDQGDASKWQFSVDRIEATIVANNLTSAGFEGAIVLPISKKVTNEMAQQYIDQQNAQNNPNGDGQNDEISSTNFALKYTAVINPVDNEYILTAATTSAIMFDVWKATAVINPESYIELKVSDNKFRPKAVLHGSMGIYADNTDVSDFQSTGDDPNSGQLDNDKTVQFQGVTFQDLQLQTEAPLISVGYMGYAGTVKLANFPVTIGDIELKTTNNSATLEFDLAINLMGGSNGFSGETRLGIKGKFDEAEGLQKWKFDGISVSEIAIAANLGGMKLEGSIELMDDDPVYGDGFKGSLMAEFNVGMNGLKVESNAIFGRTDFRYWYVDALVDNLNLPAGGIFSIKGFGGGAYYRMKKVNFGSQFNASGADYAPDEDSGLGVKAMVLFALTGSSRAINGGAGFEIAFNSSGGVNRIALYGEAHIMQGFDFPNPAAKIKDNLSQIVENELGMSQEVLENLKETNLVEVSKQVYPYNVQGEAGLNAYAAIEYDFTTRTLHGTFDLYVDVLGGLFRGRASGNRAGWAVWHFAPDKWYVHMGTPTDRLGIKFGIGSFSLETGGYFMIGDEIPGSPPPPAIVAEILGVEADVLNYMRDENALGDGRGFAYGMDFSVDTGDLTFLVFYARFQAGIGYDIMVKDYGEAECAGSGQVGINGWYANGQAYAYLQGELGIKVKLLFIRKKIPIIRAGAAVLMQAKLPNPVWFRGYVGGHFSVLGGLIKGRFRFKIELGEQCDFVNGAPLDGLKIIADINPIEGASAVDVFTLPQVGFNMRVGREFELEDDNGDVTVYRINLKEFAILDQGNPLPGQVNWNENGDLLTFTSEDILPPTTQLQLKVAVNFEEKVNGVWQVIFDEGQEAVEEEIRNFTTGTAPDYIPVSNIAYSYPVLNQKYLHKDQHDQAYVQLKQGQDYLFELEGGWSQNAYFYNEESGSTQQKAINYDTGGNRVNFAMPSLNNQSNYTLTLMTEPPGSDYNDNVSEGYSQQDLGDDNEVEVRNVELSGTASSGEEVEMLLYNFSTSEYATFNQKVVAKELIQPLVEIIYSDVHSLQTKSLATEPFEMLELNGNQYSDHQPLITVEAVLDDSYYQNEVFPLIYDGYPLRNDFTVDRDVSLLGLPPKKGVELLTWYETFLDGDPTNFLLRERLPYRYHLAYYYKEDFIDIQYKVVNAFLNDPGQYQSEIQQYDYIINGIFPYIKQGNYNTKIKYVLPGGQDDGSSTYVFNKPN